MNNKLTLTLLLSIFILLTGFSALAQVTGCTLSPATPTMCVGASITFTSTDAIAAESWTATGGSVVFTAGTGTCTYTAPGTPGSYTLTYTEGGGSFDICTATINVLAYTTAPPITGTPAICSGYSFAFTDGLSGGAWNSSNGLIASTDASGNVTGVAPGTAIISYMPGVTCGVAATYAVEIDVPFALITGSSAVCSGGTTTLNGWSPGGTWSGGTPGLALIGHHSGVVTTYSGISGTTTFTYSSPANACGGPYSANWPFAVDAPITTAGAVTTIYPTAICVGASTYYSDGLTGGTFTSDNTAVATVDPVSGTVTGVSAGTANIGYYLSNSCGTVYATTLGVTVNPLPNAGTIYGTTDVCVGGSGLPLYSTGDPYPTGTWSATGDVSIDVATGVMIAGASAGSATVTYTSTTATCGTAYTTTVVTVDALPAAITGTSAVCPVNISLLSDAVPGGAWSSSDSTIALVTIWGIQGIANGTATITYTLTNGCGTNYATTVFTVYPAANAGTITGTSTICEGTNTTLTDVGGDLGIWTDDGSGFAVVSSGGIVNGITEGLTVISYNATSAYGCTAYTLFLETVNGPTPSSGPITGGGSPICVANTTTFYGASYGGSWSSSDLSVATIDAVSGVATGISPGSANITYTITDLCGSNYATATLNIEGVLSPTITPTTGTSFNYCFGSVYANLNGTPAGGTWTSVDPDATMAGSIVIFGSPGTDVIEYTVSNSCGSFVNAQELYFPTSVTPTISGTNPENVCVGSSFLVSVLPYAAIPNTFGNSETWIVPSGIATVTTAGSNTYNINGISTGTETITYAYTNVCGIFIATTDVWVGPPESGILSYTSFPSSVSYPFSFVLSHNTVPGATGYYYTSDNSFASVDYAGNLMINRAHGHANITCTAYNGCGSVTITEMVSLP